MDESINPTNRQLGRYWLGEEIGRGAFAVVYKAENRVLKKPVAIKLMAPQVFNQPDLNEKFIQEARTGASLNHERIVRVLDLVESEGLMYMALEYMPGGDLGRWLAQHGRMPLRQVAQIVADVAEALDYAHQQNVVHGDVKPANILLDGQGRAKLADFGFLQAIVRSGASSSDVAVGTPYYLSPEQASGKTPGPAADQYALGIVAYELLAGQPPFTATRGVGLYLKHLREAPPSLVEQNPAVTPALEKVILQALAKQPEDRYLTCRAFAQELKTAVAATEAQQFQLWLSQSQIALHAHEVDEARKLLENALLIMPDDAEAQKLRQQLEAAEQAQRNYANAVTNLQEARQQALHIRDKQPQHPDPDGLLKKLTPPPTPPAKHFLQNWQLAVYLTLALLAVGFLGAIGRAIYAGTETGQPYRETQIAIVRTFPPNTPTPIPTLNDTLTRSTDGMVMVFVPGGTFQMGSNPEVDENAESNEQPQYEVTLSSFWIDCTEVTNAMYANCVTNGECRESSYADDGNYSESDYPVVGISWNDANAYCTWAEGQLPTEAQWEYAARGNDGRLYPWGDESPTCDLAQFSGCNGNTVPVGSFPDGNSWVGAADMAGNVWEWVADWYDGEYYETASANNPTGPTSGDYRVSRGGSWLNNSLSLRVANRGNSSPGNRDGSFGFRCVIIPGN